MKPNRPLLAAVAALVLPLFLAPPAAADVRLPALFTDGMVLQRSGTAPVWGWADPGEEVTVRASWAAEAPVSATAGADGAWRVDLPTGEAGGPYSLRIEGANTIEVKDVLLGEVWVCSGQSNMEWKIQGCARGIEDFAAERAAQDFPALRFFDVRNAISLSPEEDCVGTWRACTPAIWPELGAVAFYFGRHLHQELGVPIGLIQSEWGGTPAESWTSRATIATLPDFAPALERIDAALRAEDESPSLAALQAAWWRTVDDKTPGAAGWKNAMVDVSDWKPMALPALWETVPGLGSFDGVVWFRRTVVIPADWAGKDLSLELGPVDDMDTTWFNGERVGGLEGAGHWSTPRVYTVPGKLVKSGRNTIAVRALDTGGAGGFSGKPEQLVIRPVGDASAAPLSIAGAWSYRPGAAMSDLGSFPSANWFNSDYPTALHNGMIAPLIPYAIRGAIWYQGESNRDRAAQYRTLFPAMIQDWRRLWNQGDFPFYFVQIAPFNYGGDTGQAAELREAQMMTLSLPHTGMAVTMDIGEPDNIHPANKWDVGRRLAQWALAKDYGREDLAYSGPIYTRMEREGAAIRLYFEHTFGGLSSRIGPLTHFTIAGEDRVFHPAHAEIEGHTLFVWGEKVGAPVAVRYAWGAADEPNLINTAGLPASSFRTDDWSRE